MPNVRYIPGVNGQLGEAAPLRPADVSNVTPSANLRGDRPPDWPEGKPWITSNWDQEAPKRSAPPTTPNGMQVTVNDNPFDIISGQYDRSRGAVDSMTAPLELQLRQSTKEDLDLSYKQYVIDYNTLRGSKASPEQFQALNGRYQKKWVEIKSRIEPGLRDLTKARTDAMTRLALERAEKNVQLRTIQSMTASGDITESAGRRKMFEVAGISFPAGAFDAAPDMMTLKERYAIVSREVNTWDRILNNYRRDPKHPERWQQYANGSWTKVPQEEHAGLEEVSRNIAQWRPVRDSLRNQLLGQAVRVPDLNRSVRSAASPFAQSVSQSSATGAVDLSKMSNEALTRIAEGR